MKYYIEIKLYSDTEITLGFVWKKLYAQLHLALVEVRDEKNLVSVGLSFPQYEKSKFPLGDSIRIFAKTKEELERLDLDRWLSRLLDYIELSSIKEVPTDVIKFVCFGRKQFKTNAQTLARRQAKRKNISYEKALENYANFDKESRIKKNRLPFINVKSLSSNTEIKLFISKQEKKSSVDGLFSTYGLSNEITVPCF